MASTINIYAADADDFDCEGLGTLCPLDWEFVNRGLNGASLTLTHPYDADGKWQLIQAGRVIRADVPVRTVPEIEAGALVATAEVWSIKAGATKAQRYLYNAKQANNGKKIKLLPKAAQVTVIKKGADRYKATYREQVRNSKKKLVWKSWTGWMDIAALDVKIEDLDTSTVEAVERSIPSVPVRAQLFRLQQPVRKERVIEAEALPIAYDAAGILSDPKTGAVITGPDLLDRIIERAYIEPDLTLQTDIGDSRTGFEMRNVSIIGCLLDGEESFVGRYGGDVIFDDNTVTILRHAGVDRGFYATYGRNLTGIDSYEVSDDIVTAVLPVGEAANGDPLYLNQTPPYVTAPNFDQYPTPHMAELKVPEARVDEKNGVSVAKARERMAAAAAAEWEMGAHIPAITLRVEFAMLGDSEEYKSFHDIDQCHMYDIVHVWHPLACGYVDMAVCESTWDGMKERYTEMVLGTPEDRMSNLKISAGAISGGITGRQIAWGAIGAAQLDDDCIDVRHVQAESINAEAMQTQSFTAEKAFVRAMNANSLAAVTAEINSITAASVATNTLAAAFANLFAVVANNIRAGTVTADALDAVMASLVTASVGVLDVDFAHVKDLAADEAIIRAGEAGALFIDRLSVTSANMVNVVISRLILVDDSGQEPAYYAVNVGANGTIELEAIELTQEEIDAGETGDGRPILADTVVAEDISGTNIYGNSAIIADILTDALNAGQITATEALIASARIPALYATAITALEGSLTFSANQVIQMLIGVADNIRAWFTFGDSGLIVRKTGSSWSTRTADDGFYIEHDEVTEPVGAFRQELLEVHGLKVGRTDDDIICRRTSSGGWVWTD